MRGAGARKVEEDRGCVFRVTAIDLRNRATLYAKNAMPIAPTIGNGRHTASIPPPR